MDAITVLRADHRHIEELSRAFERAGSGAEAARAGAVDGLVRALSLHAAVEEQVLYPALFEEMPAGRDYVLDSIEEHHVVKWLCDELDRMTPADARFDPKARVLIGFVRYHVGEEEAVLFPEIRSTLGRRRLTELGRELEEARAKAPTRPHPRLTDPPSMVAGLVAGAVDRVRDAGKRAVEEARHAAS